MISKKEALEYHKEKRGKVEIKPKASLTEKELGIAYTPGVAEVCKEISANKKDIYKYTIKGNSVAVVTDGSAVLGLGNIGPEAALPVMEGKSMIFKQFANIDAFPICLNTQDTKEIIDTIRNIAPGFGGINIEDISAPKCFEIEAALKDLGIPVFHDDQHGTAVVVLAALINSVKVLGKKLEDLKIVINGAGAAGIAVTKLLLCYSIDKKICTPVKDVMLCDSKGIIYEGREGLNPSKEEIAKITNLSKRSGTLKDALKEADVFIGVSKGNVLKKEMIKTMNPDPIIFAMANPEPEIMPDDAYDAGAAIVGTGRSCFPNQINNSLVFPAIFRGAFDAKAKLINHTMKMAAANALATFLKNPSKDKILPGMFDKGLVEKVSSAVKKAAEETGA